ncbi:SEC1 family transport protein SLY1 [Nosema bombycis CQ1]|uniref:SEC1 family transport protein SLY1 n=1 Tax=Nosema bombycis (strain CQ1 / CVCC 102059) TaxID=578461 RepID=R0KNP7_NOSB1|nr:SEC1 family transport protein SLY1 [Nosema bombycis CQ1]|eukprot:EOB12306.1 SEC1 family transport protein SLY1 [Nosema bombycis CQ1]
MNRTKEFLNYLDLDNQQQSSPKKSLFYDSILDEILLLQRRPIQKLSYSNILKIEDEIDKIQENINKLNFIEVEGTEDEKIHFEGIKKILQSKLNCIKMKVEKHKSNKMGLNLELEPEKGSTSINNNHFNNIYLEQKNLEIIESSNLEGYKITRQRLLEIENIQDTINEHLQIQDERIDEVIGRTGEVLILDKRSQDIISPLIKLNELRDCGVTSYFLINQKRNKIESTPAIYFISNNNINSILNDIDLYSNFHINCVTSIKIRDLEKLGYELSSKGLGLRIGSVYDQFLDFISLQDDLFSLEIKDSYILKENTDLLINTVLSLLSVFVTLEGIPLIYCKDDKTIGKMLSDKIKGTNIIKNNEKRPLLIIVDRDYDIITPIQHVWSYSALIHDLLGIEKNKVMGSKGGKDDGSNLGKDNLSKDNLNNNITNFNLDPSDKIWKLNSNEYFPLVVERVDKEFVDYKKEMALRSLDSRSDKKTIQEALEKAPELAKRNESVNSHISICLEMVDIIKNRNIDDFYKIEKSGFTNEEILEISEKGNDLDILRLGLSIYQKDKEISEAIIKKRNLKDYDEVIKFFKSKNPVIVEDNKFILKSVVSGIVGNVKRLLPEKEKSPISELVEEIYYKIKNEKYEEIIDPIKNSNKDDVSSIVVFTLGGSTYSELKTLKILEEKIKIPIYYGGTEILNACEFIRQIKEKVNK